MTHRTIKLRIRGFRFWLGIGIIILMMILAGANTNNVDLATSKIEYERFSLIYQGEWLNYYVEQFFRGIGASYEVYRLFLYIVGYILIFSTLFKFYGFSTYVVVLYAIYPFTIDFVQTPNFCSMALFIFSTRFLVNVETLKNKILYVIFCLMSAGMHSIGYIYLPIIVIVLFSKNKNVTKYGLLYSSIGLVIGIMDRLGHFVPRIANAVFRNDLRVRIYFNSTTRYGFLLYWLIMILAASIALIAYKMYFINEDKIDETLKHENYERQKYTEVIYLISCYGMLLMPIVGYAGTIFRLIRNYFILIYGAWNEYVKHIRDMRVRLAVRILFFAFPIFMFLIENEAVRTATFNIFKNNWLIHP